MVIGLHFIQGSVDVGCSRLQLRKERCKLLSCTKWGPSSKLVSVIRWFGTKWRPPLFPNNQAISPMTDPWCCYIWCSMDPIFSIFYHQYTPFMLAYIPAPWIRHGSVYHFSKQMGAFPARFFHKGSKGSMRGSRRAGGATWGPTPLGKG